MKVCFFLTGNLSDYLRSVIVLSVEITVLTWCIHCHRYKLLLYIQVDPGRQCNRTGNLVALQCNLQFGDCIELFGSCAFIQQSIRNFELEIAKRIDLCTCNGNAFTEQSLLQNQLPVVGIQWYGSNTCSTQYYSTADHEVIGMFFAHHIVRYGCIIFCCCNFDFQVFFDAFQRKLLDQCLIVVNMDNHIV
ncbi:hypothetical protein D3C72_476090 [compost metagenome]